MPFVLDACIISYIVLDTMSEVYSLSLETTATYVSVPLFILIFIGGVIRLLFIY